MKNTIILPVIVCGIIGTPLRAQEQQNRLHPETGEAEKPFKVLHAEPLYIDLIRDLGARKGEREWNVAAGIIDNQTYDRYEALVEYEWAPMDRLGLEVELPFSFYYAAVNGDEVPTSKLNSLKLAAQYSFLVSERFNLSMAAGYIQEIELTEFANYGKRALVPGAVYNPFLVIARRWGSNWHSLVYTGPVFEHHFHARTWNRSLQINSNIHYMIPGTRNFVGCEFNKEVGHHGDFDMTIRPQMRVGITDQLMVGIVTGIPVSRENQRFSTFLRMIYEPAHK